MSQKALDAEMDTRLDQIVKKGFWLFEIREYQLRLVAFVFENKRGDRCIYTKSQLSERIQVPFDDIEVEPEPEPAGTWTRVLTLMSRQNDDQSGFFPQPKEFICIIAKFFFHVETNILDEIKPFVFFPPQFPFLWVLIESTSRLSFAQSCHLIHQHTGKLIHSDFIKLHMSERLKNLNRKANLSHNQLKNLKRMHEEKLPERKWRNGKNAPLVAYLHGLTNGAFFIEEAVHYCSEATEQMQECVRKYLGTKKIQFAPPKNAYRVRQKYDEYAGQYLHPTVCVFKKFKDLFRGSILHDDYLQILNRKTERLSKHISSISYRYGVYQACYVILNVYDLNFELKVVSDLDAEDDSRQWYELQRNSSLENFEEYIKRGISSTRTPSPFPERDPNYIPSGDDGDAYSDQDDEDDSGEEDDEIST